MTFASFFLTFIQSVSWWIPAAVESFSAAARASSQQAALVAVTTVWQGALIAVGLAMILRFAPRVSAGHRFSIWTAAFGALVLLPLISFLADFSSVPVGGSVSPVGAATGSWLSRPLLSIDARWSLLIAALWVGASLVRGVDLGLHSFRLRKLWKDAVPVEVDDSLSSMLTGVRRGGMVQVCTTTTLQRPSVIGFFRPRILIPDWLFARLTPGELQQIVLHEAEHLRRRDDWTNLVQKICLVLFPLNPALVWIERRLCREREMACDDGVVRITRAPRAYAACLASLAERGLQHRAEALSLGAWQRRPELVHRVQSILRRKHTLGPAGNRAMLGALGCSLLFGSIEMARCPQLIAFVPPRNLGQNVAVAQDAVPVDSRPETSSRKAGVRRVNAAYIATRSRTAGQVASTMYALAIATNPRLVGSANRESVGTVVSGEGAGSDRAVLSKTPSYKACPTEPRAFMLKTELPSAQQSHAQVSGRISGRGKAQSGEAQAQWIVLTTWEQVQIPNHESGLSADYETGADSTASTEVQDKVGKAGQPGSGPVSGAVSRSSSEGGSQVTDQITVTRLFLRILPTSSETTQQAIVPTRGGWFVLQL